MRSNLVAGPLTTTQSETGVDVLKHVLISNTHATDPCAFILKSVDANGKIIAQGSVLAGSSLFLHNLDVGCNGVYVSLTGGTGAVMCYF
jgi:hypothetical protein